VSGSKTRTCSDDSMNDDGRLLPVDPLCVIVLFKDGLGDVLLGVGDGLLDARAVPPGFPVEPHETIVPPFDVVVVVHDADALPP
jgi:hypothetical protein